MPKYPNIRVVISEIDATPTKIILKVCSALARNQAPSWERMEFMEKALACNEFNLLKNVCKNYVCLKNGSKTLVF